MNIKEIMGDTKKKSIILLFFWFLFAFFIIFFVKNTTPTKVVKKQPVDYVNYSSYEFTMKSKTLDINGVYYKEKALIFSGNDRYYMEDNSLYKIDGNNLVKVSKINKHTITKLQPKYLGKLINDSKHEVTINLEENIVKKNYSINAKDYYKLYDEEIEKDFIIPLSVYLKNDYIIKIEFSDLTITYKNINKIKEFNADYKIVNE